MPLPLPLPEIRHLRGRIRPRQRSHVVVRGLVRTIHSGDPRPSCALQLHARQDGIDCRGIATKPGNKRSILDYYNDELKRSAQLAPASGKDILQEYADSIRDLEKRLSHAVKWREIPYPEVDCKAPGADLSPTKDLFLTYELMALALKYDLTRVITYALPTDSLLKEMQSELNSHGMSHAEKSEIAFKRDHKHAAALAHFLDKLKETKTPDGRDLLYHTTVTIGAGCRHGHGTKNVPMIIAGQGGGRYQQGKNVILSPHTTDICDLWYTILKGYEPEMNSFKSGRNEISELLA